MPQLPLIEAELQQIPLDRHPSLNALEGGMLRYHVLRQAAVVCFAICAWKAREGIAIDIMRMLVVAATTPVADFAGVGQTAIDVRLCFA